VNASTQNEPFVVWITGLPGSGKSTLAKGISEHFDMKNIGLAQIDGDAIRATLNLNGLHGIDDRKRIARVYCDLAFNLYNQGFSVIVSTVSLFTFVEQLNRSRIFKFFLIVLRPDKSNLVLGPRKSQYLEMENVYTVDISPEFPDNPDLEFSDFSARSEWLETSVRELEKFLER
jgi:adenylylsulfate kinase